MLCIVGCCKGGLCLFLLECYIYVFQFLFLIQSLYNLQFEFECYYYIFWNIIKEGLYLDKSQLKNLDYMIKGK